MKQLTARDALSEHLVHAAADTHLSESDLAGQREAVYAVEEARATPGVPRVLGVVDSRLAMRFPHRILADLVRPWRQSYVTPDTPLDRVQRRLLDEMVCCLPVMDESGKFYGAITRSSVLKVLLGQEQQMIQTLRQGLDLQEQQRSLLAFEIHDGLIQYITAARLHLQTAVELAGGLGAEAAEQFGRGMAALQDAFEEARCLIGGLHPPTVEGVGLIAAVEALVEQQQSLGDVEIEFVAGKGFIGLSRFQETTIFRIVQEALTNARRHSGSPRIRVELSQEAGQIRVDVRDWGCGFDLQASFDGYGLKGIRHRARVLQGDASITSSSGLGTHVAVQFPVTSTEPEGRMDLC
jgi:signal transduction histidine kinase